MTGHISGTVRDGGNPVENSLVQLFHKPTGSLIAYTYSAADGSFTFTGLNTSLVKEYFTVAHDIVVTPQDDYNFQDQSGIIWTPHGNATLTADHKKFGRTALNLTGAGDYLTAPTASGLDFGSGPFTVEAQVRPASLGQMWIYTKSSTTSSIAYEYGFAISEYYMRFYHGIRGSNQSELRLFWPTPLVANTMQHIMVSRDASGNWYCAKNGVFGTDYQNAPLAGSISFGAVTTGVFNNAVDLGSTANPGTIGGFGGFGGEEFVGQMDELRILKDAPYVSAFTPPTAPYDLSDNADTSVLMHFNVHGTKYRAVIVDQLTAVP